MAQLDEQTKASNDEIDLDDLEWGGDYIPHKKGRFRAKFIGCEAFLSDYKDDHGNRKKQVRLKFETSEKLENGERCTITCTTSPSFNSKAKIRPLLEAFNVDVSKLDRKSFRIQDYFGRKLELLITHEPRKDGEGIYSKITSFIPVAAAGEPAKPKDEPKPEAKPEPAAAAPAGEWDDDE